MSKNNSVILSVKNLTVYYGVVKALENASFEVHPNEIVAMIGPNGAGKSTALKVVSGVLPATDGEIRTGEIEFDGKNIKGLRTDQLVHLGMTLLPEGRRVFKNMTVRENLEMGGYIRNDKKEVRNDIDRILEFFPQLKERTKQRAGTLSGGEQQMLALGRSLMLKPKLLLADEPSLGLSPNYVDILFDKLVEINKNGTSILLVEQNAMMALEICHRAYVYEIGKIVLDGDRESLVGDERVKKAYLGG